MSKFAAHRVVDHLAPLLALTLVARRHSPDNVLVVDGTLVPVYVRAITALSNTYRYSVNMQVVIDANTRLVVAVGRPVPGNHNDGTANRETPRGVGKRRVGRRREPPVGLGMTPCGRARACRPPGRRPGG